jgi:adenosylcobinamide-phosphate synthase
MTAIGCSVIGAFLYKAINTMDSMIGYKNVKYVEFGRVAARLDDFVNFIPSRISGFMLILAAFTLNLDYRGAFKIFLRDRLSHSSPNAGHTEAAVAGALGIRLGGPASYFGKIIVKPFIGDDIHKITPEHIRLSNKLALVGALFFIAAFLSLRGVISLYN